MAGMLIAGACAGFVGCEKEADMLGRDDRDGRMASLSEPSGGSIQPVSYEAQNPRGGEGSGNRQRVEDDRGRESAQGAGLDTAGASGRSADQRRTSREGGGASSSAVDRGTAQVIAMMEEALGVNNSGGFRTSIAIRALRNQSRTASQEIEVLRDRLLSLFNATAAEESLTFTREVNDATEYTLSATVYLIQRDGFDQWEIYFALRPADANWTIWRNEEPVRMLRQKSAGVDDSMQVVRGR